MSRSQAAFGVADTPTTLLSGRASTLTVTEGIIQPSMTSEKVAQPVLHVDDPILAFSRTRKWIVTLVACSFTLLVSAATTSYTMGFTSMMRDLDCTRLEAVLGLSTYVIAFGIFPLLTSAFSEEFGRQPLYFCSLAVFLLMHVAVALSPNYQAIVVFRFIQGAAGSAGATMVAGTIADIWVPQERGLPMSLYSILAFGGNGIGTLMGGWIEMNPRLGWKWIQWISLIFGGALALVFFLVMQETRSAVITRKRVKASGEKQLESKVGLPPPKLDLKAMLWISATRPLILFLTEPIIFAMSLWIGFVWGVFYCMIASVPQVFSELHGFNIGEVGTVNIAMLVAVFIGYFTNLFQERIYHTKVVKRFVEARLYMCCAAAALFPISMIMFAWFCRSDIHWIALAISFTLYLWAVFTIYLAIFSYLADCYDTYASSALAGQSLIRNVIGGIFPLFTTQMFDALGYSWANTIFAIVGVLMIPIPVTLLFWGSRIRARSSRCIKDGVPTKETESPVSSQG
ncbi:multidrug transporter [Coprinopsis cinerea okayama7|uniref:Multidrug transporter n=1 Tax=Coprinopsis cinerea (strain Okayama-7 / 130 / ATCC MYA-4618 / FGSC 9003) TaxID=240176 RepID=A8NA75_COPC7|nr:multidrug transporter [Coprinopsis cinerea okayama7\|eukprot:XP_001831729.1 multidrug transporter [Coprinopsis cinerea okayama7\